jgi:RNA polymerase sigma factor (sigma-70 family)
MARRANRAQDDLVELTGLIRRVITSRVRSAEDAEDLMQETLVRVAGAQGRLDRDALPGYAVVTARNVIAARSRQHARDRRHIHRLVEYTSLAEPEELTLRREENNALAAALDQLPPTDRDLLVAHEVEGANVEALGTAAGTTPTAIAMRLSRARARLRLEFVLALRSVHDLPPHCRAVLLALSSGDTRRQHALDTGHHLATCETCADLCEPLVERRRATAGWFPIAAIAAAGRSLRNEARTHAPQTAAGVGAVVAAAVAVVAVAVTASNPAAVHSPVPTTVGQRPAALTANGTSLLPIPPNGLAPYQTDLVQATAITVFDVIPGEGAWVGLDLQNQVWVEFTNPDDTNAEPRSVPPILKVGQQIDFTARLSNNPTGYGAQLGFDPSRQAALDAAGFHLHSDPATVSVRPRR